MTSGKGEPELELDGLLDVDDDCALGALADEETLFKLEIEIDPLDTVGDAFLLDTPFREGDPSEPVTEPCCPRVGRNPKPLPVAFPETGRLVVSLAGDVTAGESGDDVLSEPHALRTKVRTMRQQCENATRIRMPTSRNECAYVRDHLTAYQSVAQTDLSLIGYILARIATDRLGNC